MNRKEEAAAEWLTFRGYDKNIQNAEQLKQLLQTIETKLSQYDIETSSCAPVLRLIK
jgi:hypothetical protein